MSSPLDPPGPPPPGRGSRQPLLDPLGKLCVEGKQAAEYLWQVPDDAKVRAQVLGVLEKIATLSREQGRHEMGRIVDELTTAAKASPSPQQVDMLVDGFDRLTKLWQAAKSGLL
ncbi:MAG: hypothetical protein ACREMN_10025 [Gemmatimonadales bacterium]